MLKYYYPDDQTLRVTGGQIPFGCFSGLLLFTGLTGFASVPLLLIKFKVIDPYKNYGLFCSIGYFIGLIIMVYIIRKFEESIYPYRSVIFICRDGRITVNARGWNFILRTYIFERDNYKFRIQKVHHEGDNEGMQYKWDEYRMNIVDENGRQFTLFVVKEPEEVSKFEKIFSDFTGLDPEILKES
jgi:hypothetical protein